MSRTEHIEPFALFGDYKDKFNKGVELEDGQYNLSLTSYSGPFGFGSVLEDLDITIDIGEYEGLKVNYQESVLESYSDLQDVGDARITRDGYNVVLESGAWKTVDIEYEILQDTVLRFSYKTFKEGEIQGIGFINANGDLEETFFQLDGSQLLGIQDYNNDRDGFFEIEVGKYFTGSFDKLVLVNDDDNNTGAMSQFTSIELGEFV